MTTNPVRGEVWRIRFDPAEGDEIKKIRTAMVISENAIGRLKLKIVVPITETSVRELSLVCATDTDARERTDQRLRGRRLPGQSISESRFLERLGELATGELDDIANAIAICFGAP